MPDDYWSKPYPGKGIIRESAVAPTPAAPRIIDISKLRPPIEMPPPVVESAPPPEPKIKSPTVDSWPAAPPGFFYTMIPSEDPLELMPGHHGRIGIHPQMMFKGMFLWCRPMRDVWLGDYKIGNLSQMIGYGRLATTIFRRFVPFETCTCNIGNIVSLEFHNGHSSRIYRTEVAILALVNKEHQY